MSFRPLPCTKIGSRLYIIGGKGDVVHRSTGAPAILLQEACRAAGVVIRGNGEDSAAAVANGDAQDAHVVRLNLAAALEDVGLEHGARIPMTLHQKCRAFSMSAATTPMWFIRVNTPLPW